MIPDEAATNASTERDPVERLAEEFVERRRQGEAPSIAEYAEKYPELALRIRDLFPTLLLMEDLRPGPDATCEDRALFALPRSGSIERLGDFRIVREIGRGGMGVVYEAEQESLGRRVALKVLPAACVSSPTRLRRFHREAQAAARLHHTNIVPVFGVGQQDGLHYYVMQLISGQGLDRVLGALSHDASDALTVPCGEATAPAGWEPGETFPASEAARLLLSGRLAPDAESPSPSDDQPPIDLALPRPEVLADRRYFRAVARMGVQVADALEYAHQQGTLHRDIKPANLLLDNRGTVWVADFGLAKLAEMDDLTHSGDVVGTLRYMAPEQFDAKSDARSDVYSLGLTLYELLTLRPAFDEKDRRRLIRQVTQEEPLRPRKLNPAIPRDLETIVVKAIACSPVHRYQTAGALAADLKCFLEDRPIRARRTTVAGRVWRWCRRNRAVAFLSGTALALLVAIAAVASIGYLNTSRALHRVSEERELADTARRQAEAERERTAAEHQRAEANLRLATRAFEDIFSKVAADPVSRPLAEDNDEEDQWTEPTWENPVTEKDASLLASMLKFYDQFAQQNQADVKLQKETAKANRRVGDIQRRLGQYDKAEAAYRGALAAYQRLAPTSSDDADCSTAIAAIHNELADVYRNTGRFFEANRSHLQAKEVLDKQPPQVARLAESRFELARTYRRLSFVMPPRRPARSDTPGGPARPGASFGQGPEPGEYNRKASEILKNLIAEDPNNPRYRLAMARCHRDQFASAAFGGRSDEANRSRQEAIGIIEKLVADFPANPEYRCELAETYAMPIPRQRQGKVADGAVEQVRRAVGIGTELVARYPSVPEYKASLGRWCVHLSEVLRAAGSLADAETSLLKAVELHKDLAAEFASLALYRFLLARSLHQLAEIQTARNEPSKARATLEESIANLKKLQQFPLAAPYLRGPIAMNYTNLAKTLRQLGENTQADEAAAKAKEAAGPFGPPHFGPFHRNREKSSPPK